MGVAQHLGGDRTATLAVSAGGLIVRGCMSMNLVHIWEMGLLLPLTVVCIPEQPAETLLSPVEEEAGSLPGRVNCNCLGKVLTRSVLLIPAYGRGADRKAPCKFISAV